MAKRSMSLVGFMQAGSTTVYAGSWRHPATEHGFLDAGYYAKLGRILEQGCFDMLFFDDRLAMPGIYGGSVAEAVRVGARPVKLDLSVVLGVIAGVTERIGLGATYSTTYYSPFHVARTFATLDHLTGGRAAWNVVTSVNDSEAQNFGLEGAPGPRRALRPRRRVPRGHHRAVGLLGGRRPRARPGRRRLRRPGQGPRAGLPGQVVQRPRPADRAPVAPGPPGAPAGRVVGTGPRLRRPLGRADLHRGSRHRHRPFPLQGPEGAHGRRLGAIPRRSRCCPWPTRSWASPGPTPRSASRSSSTTSCDPMASLTLLSELMNYDFSTMSLDDADHRRAHRVGLGDPRPGAEPARAHRRDTVTLARPGRAPGHPAAGTALRRHRRRGGRPDGGVVRDRAPATGSSSPPPTSPGAYEDVVRMVVPELQRRGVFRTRYTGPTLRDTLGSPGRRRSPVAEPTGPAPGAPGDRRRHPGRRAGGGHRPRASSGPR